MSKSMEDEKELIEKLLRMVKREVKQIMEEAVTRKFIHEDSGSITSLCATVDVCLSHGLKRRALGLFKTNSTTALLQKVAKNCEAAATVLRKVQEIENNDPNKRSSSSSDSMHRTRMSFKLKSSPNPNTGGGGGGSQNNTNNNNNTTNNNNNSANNANANSNSASSGNVVVPSPTKHRYLWIRIALFEKYLVSIVDHVVQNSSKYYERDALVADPVAGQILASLLVGPCALDFTKMRTQDQFWNDPPADELVQRHKISSSIGSTTNSPSLTQSTPPLIRKRLGMNYKKSLVVLSNGGGGDDLDHAASGSPVSRTSNICWSPRDYVESLHQNSKSTLLYGKNNVVMQPSDVQEPMPGYLSLHQHSSGLTIKWTPNQLINGRVGQQNSSGEENIIISNSLDKTNAFWNYSLNVNVENIVYLHCHQQKQSCGSIVMVGRDGVMHPPILFPKGGHLLAFLSCLENGLIPYGQLDPPLWSEKGKGKILPKLRRKARSSSNDSLEDTNNNNNNEDVATDYVFRIISMCDKSDDISPEMFEPKSSNQDNQPPNHDGDPNQQSKTTTVENNDPRTLSTSPPPVSSTNGQSDSVQQPEIQTQTVDADKQNIQLLCDSMKKQIISRAFYGWLAYCRHFKTVRTHLAVLVNPKIYPIDQPTDASKGITKELWTQIQAEDGRIKIDPMEFYRLVYYGGVDHSIRSQVWLYLLQHHNLDDDQEEKKKHDQQIRHKYEMIMSEWLAVEAIVRQRDKEIVAANLAKLSSESTNNDSQEMSMDKSILQTCKSLTNEVFEDGGHTTTNDQMIDQKDKKNGGDGGGGLRRESSVDGDPTDESANSAVVQPNQLSESFNDSDNVCEAKATANINRKPLVRHKQIESIASVGSISGSSSTGTQNIFITNPSVDRPQMLKTALDSLGQDITDQTDQMDSANLANTKLPVSTIDGSGGSQCVSPASSNGGLYTNELLDLFSLNLHRIDKDVQRCDRNFWYFSKENLEKLRNVMCTYVWDHLEIGYVQGMCDLVAPLLVIFDDEVYTYSCFCKLMKRMASNFPNGGAMDRHFANMRSLIQILDADIFELMHQNGDYTHFYFCYRWFLLDFKREFNYDDVFSVWETIWAAKHVSSASFVLFIALALVEYYRDIILENNMDFTDIIKFFNEMAERHDAKAVLNIARDLVHQIQTLMENK